MYVCVCCVHVYIERYTRESLWKATCLGARLSYINIYIHTYIHDTYVYVCIHIHTNSMTYFKLVFLGPGLFFSTFKRRINATVEKPETDT
jgi:hypothetical protein